MTKHTYWVLLVSLAIGAMAAGGGEAPGPRADVDSPRLASLSEALKADRSSVLEAFWKEMQGKAPLIEPIKDDERHLRVTFIWRGDDKTKTVRLMGGLPAAALHKPLSRLGDADLWYRTERLPKTTRITYAFRVDVPPENPSGMDEAVGSMLRYPPRVDALNPKKHFMFSVLELPDAPPQPWIKARPDVPRGTVAVQAVDSAMLGQKRDLVVYTPGGYEDMASKCSLLVVFDAEVYTPAGVFTLIPTPTILDNLIADRKIPPTVAVFIKNLPRSAARNRELACSPEFADFVAKELIPWVHKHYRVSDEPRRAVICGASLGGLCAAYCGLRHSDVIGNVLSQSGSFAFSPGHVTRFPTYDVETGWLTRQFVKASRLPLRFYLEIGRFERFYEVDSVLEHRRFRDVLEAKDYPVVYSEFDGGHDYFCLRGSLADGLISLLGENKGE